MIGAKINVKITNFSDRIKSLEKDLKRVEDERKECQRKYQGRSFMFYNSMVE